MSISSSHAAGTLPQDAADIVRAYLDASMVPDPMLAARYVAPHVTITFTGGRKYDHPTGPTKFNAGRYKWVKKRMESFDVVGGRTAAEGAVVYSIGTLFGEWPDGTPFEGNRYVDRFVVRDGLIEKMDVWNDSAEILLLRHGIEA
jgi:hypothetical protein